MKHLVLPLLPLLALLPLHAEEKLPSTIQITVDYVEATPAVATELLHGSKAPASSKEWHEALRKLLGEESSKLVATLSVTTKSGQRATAESIKERIYATEFSPAAGRKEHSPAVPSGLSGVDIPTPTAFEMRPVGARLEVDPVVSADGEAVDLNLAPEITYDLGVEPQVSLPAEGGSERVVMSMPKFYTLKTQTSTSVTDGGSSLIGVLMPPSEHESPDGEKRILCFVTARIVKG